MNNLKNMQVIAAAGLVGAAAGLVGAVIFNAYLTGAGWQFPFLSDFYYRPENYPGANLVIRDAKKVVVEQDTKVKDTASVVRSSLAALYKTATAEQIKMKSVESFYFPDKSAAEGLIVSSDGWIALVLPAEIKPADLIKNYTIVLPDKSANTIVKIVPDSVAGAVFAKIDKKNLSPARFAGSNGAAAGDTMIIPAWERGLLATAIAGIRTPGQPFFSSEADWDRWELEDGPAKSFHGSFAFNLSGEAVALSDYKGAVYSVSAVSSAVPRLLSAGQIARNDLGVSYLLLDSAGAEKELLGALLASAGPESPAVRPGSPAAKAGLKAGDVIISINGIKISSANRIFEVVNNLDKNEPFTIQILRADKSMEVKAVL